MIQQKNVRINQFHGWVINLTLTESYINWTEKTFGKIGDSMNEF